MFTIPGASPQSGMTETPRSRAAASSFRFWNTISDGTPARLDSRAMTQADLTRQRLIRAALELFTTTGYHLTTTPLIARKAGVAEGTIYRHFDSKQHLLNELYRAAGRWAVRVV